MTRPAPPPATLPLPGGVDGATVRLHPLRSGILRVPPGWFLREPGLLGTVRGYGIGVDSGDLLRAPVVSFLLEHPGAGPVLVDTGLHPSVAQDPAGNFGRLNAFALRGMRLAPEGSVRRQLEERGTDPGAVRTVLMTHLHVDHASALSEFPGTTVVVDGREWEAAHRQGERHGYRLSQLDADVEYRLLDLDAAGARPHATFGRSVDVFGDGSVRALSTPGHTLGHLSFAIRTARGEVLVAGDAIYTLANLEEGREPLRIEDRGAYHRTLQQLRAYRGERPDAVIVPGHDAEHWETLDPVY